MSVLTVYGTTIPDELADQYFDTLVNKFFKILPLRENEESSLPIYMKSLQAELVGVNGILFTTCSDSRFISLAAKLQYLIDHPDCEISFVKREVFGAIAMCNGIRKSFVGKEAGG